MDYNLIMAEAAKLLFGGVLGTVFTSYYKDFKAKKQLQKQLFFRLIVARGHLKIPQTFIDDLNTIQVLFKGCKKVLAKYEVYFKSLSDGGQTNRQHLLWDLLREMGAQVGYKNLDNKTLDENYIPLQSVQDLQSEVDFRAELLLYLKNGNILYEILQKGAVLTAEKAQQKETDKQ